MIVVFDTNIWEGNAYLQSPAGAAVRFYLRQQGAYVGVPEVIRLEIEQHLDSDIKLAINALEKNHKLLLRLFGKMKDLVLPTAEEVKEKVNGMIDSIGVQIINVPFSLESARSSFMKIISKEPPSSKNNQQFKDGVIWADCLNLAKREDVLLITNDKGFYQNGNIAEGIAENLLNECSKLSVNIEILNSIDSFLSRSHPVNEDISMNYIVDNLLSEEDIAIKMANNNGFKIDEITEISRKLFATEKPNIMYVTFEILIKCADITDDGRIGAKLRILGETDYNLDSKNFGHIKRTGDFLTYKIPGGSEVERQSHYLSGSITIGHRDIFDQVRFLLPD